MNWTNERLHMPQERTNELYLSTEHGTVTASDASPTAMVATDTVCIVHSESMAASDWLSTRLSIFT